MVSDRPGEVSGWRPSGLNPCSNGIWSLTRAGTCSACILRSLNPCSNGIWSLTSKKGGPMRIKFHVLILVLMEYGLWLSLSGGLTGRRMCLNPCSNGIWSLTNSPLNCEQDTPGLNPCSNGIWSLTYGGKTMANSIDVLILVLMEYGLWHYTPLREGAGGLAVRLNPCSNGIWSLTNALQGGRYDKRVLILVLMEYGLWHFALSEK